MPRKCNCAGGCGPQGGGLETIAFFERPEREMEWEEWISQQGDSEDLARWKKNLHASARRVYNSDKHTDARMPLGGIGTGNIEIGADGQLTTMQLFNTLRDGYVPFFFAVKARNTAKLLQTAGGPDWPRIARIEMTGEYPVATLKFRDPQLPVQLEMEAFSPFAPLDTRLSSMPVICFVFRIKNPTAVPQNVSLAAFMQNPVGYDAMGVPISFNSVGFNAVSPRLGVKHPNLGGNETRELKTAGAVGLLMKAKEAPPPTLDRPIRVFTNLSVSAMNSAPLDRPRDLAVEFTDRLRAGEKPAGDRSVAVWLEEAGSDLDAGILATARDLVKAGATLVFSGKQMPLLESYARITEGKPLDSSRLRPDVVFEDFESGYDRWTVEGNAFGKAPARGTLPNQQRVSGFAGKGLVNTYLGGDESLGRLIRQPFTITRNYIRFLVGGGGYQKETAIRLVIDNKIVRSTSGKNDERLLPAHWDVREFAGKQAHIEIVDDAKGGWGHINVDQIEFSDLPSGAGVVQLLDELLPVRFSSIKRAGAGGGVVELMNLTYKPGARESTAKNGATTFSWRFGAGSVVVVADTILDPAEVELTGARQQAYVSLCDLAQSKYSVGNGVPPSAPGFGELALATKGPQPSTLPGFTDWGDAWKRFADHGRFAPGEVAAMPTANGQTVNCAVSSTVTVPAGKTVQVPFLLSWRYPNKYNPAGAPMGNEYAKEWPSVEAVVKEASVNFTTIRERTQRFVTGFYDSTLPYWLLDCITSQISTVRHVGVVFRTENGDCYGWEGSNGCCTPTCTHVWGYEQTLARIFPDLERDMRRIDYKHQQRPDGGINNRTDFPSPPHPTGEQPFTDGHASCILKAYREALNHPDESWMREYWPNVKRAVVYLIARDAKGKNPSGTLDDEQWNTYDDAIHGVNSFTGSYYLAALRAGEEFALRMGDNAFAGRCRQIFEDGKRNLTEKCWNGEYYFQDLPDAEQRWGEYGKGCLSDQLIGQWWAHQLGLGYVLPKDHVRMALKSIFKHNWLPDHSNWKHNQRPFAGGKDKGLLICSWPKGGRPQNPLPYVDEVWTGVEYQVAAHMIYEGMIEEAFLIIKGARDRYDGAPRAPMPRSPWNEIECGGHYARAMSSWSILLALSGFEYDGTAKALRFTPRCTTSNFKSAFTGPEGWGTVRQTRTGRSQTNEVAVVEGAFPIARLHLDPPGKPSRVAVRLGRAPIQAVIKPRMDGINVVLSRAVTVKAGERLIVSLG